MASMGECDGFFGSVPAPEGGSGEFMQIMNATTPTTSTTPAREPVFWTGCWVYSWGRTCLCTGGKEHEGPDCKKNKAPMGAGRMGLKKSIMLLYQ